MGVKLPPIKGSCWCFNLHRTRMEMFTKHGNKKPHEASQRKSPRIALTKKRIRRISSIETIAAEMDEISKGQKRIREGQKEVREKFKDIRKEAAKLKEETDRISRQSAANQLRIDLMFHIVKAREDNDSAKDAPLTQTLRELMSEKRICEESSS